VSGSQEQPRARVLSRRSRKLMSADWVDDLVLAVLARALADERYWLVDF
jgi:hypothetical protein